MSGADNDAARISRAADREHSGAETDNKRHKSGSEAVAAHPTMTDPKLRKGHPEDGWRNKPVDEARAKDLKEGELEGATRRQHNDK